MNIQNVDDRQCTVTLNAFFVLRWTDKRIYIDQEKFRTFQAKGIAVSSLILKNKNANFYHWNFMGYALFHMYSNSYRVIIFCELNYSI